MQVLTSATTEFMTTFHSYTTQFQTWGTQLFFALLAINLVWLCLWQAVEKSDISQSMPDFLKRFTVILFFYTFMSRPDWLQSIPDTASAMGGILAGIPLDPSSLISAGIGVANKIISPVSNSSLLTIGFSFLFIIVVYFIILFCFISIALDLALTLIMSSVLVCVSTFFLGFAALSATSQIARQTLDVLLANAVKLLGLYLVVAAGSKTISTVANSIPTSAMSLDGYVWISVSVLLFWLVAKNVPNQLASIVSGSLQASRGTSVAALAITAGQQGRLAMAAGAKIMGAAQGIAKIAGSTLNNAASRFNGAMDKTGSAGLGAIGAAAGAVGSLAKSTGGNVADHFKNVGSKMAGGPGRSVAGVSERLYKDAQGQKAKASPPKGPRVT